MKLVSSRRFWACILALCMIISLIPTHFYIEAEAVSGVNSLTCSSFISNPIAQKYIDTMMRYYINSNSSLQSTLNNGNSVVFMFEGGSDNYWNGYTYGGYGTTRNQAVVIVVKMNSSGNAYIAYYCENCSSIPDQPTQCTYGVGNSGSTTLMDGIYSFYTWNHTGPYGAFQINVNYGYYTPTSYPNGQVLGASGINIHTRSTNLAYSGGGVWSAGCQVIGTGAYTGNEFNQFVKTVAGISYNVWLDYYNKSFNTISSGITKGYYVCDRQLGMLGTDGTLYGSGSLINLYNSTALTNIAAKSTTARNTAGYSLDYVDQCTYYSSYCKIKCTLEGAPINSQPCSESTANGSETLETASLGDTFTATGLYKNLYGNYWYRIKTSSGETGYIYGGEVEYIDDIISDVTITGYDVPNGHVKGATFYVNGTVKTTYNELSSVACYIYSGFGTNTEAVTGTSDKPSSKSYTLKGSAVDNDTWMGTLETGNYTYQITATYTNYYSVGATTLKSNSDTLVLVDEYFAVIPAAADQSSCNHTNTTHVLEESSCLTNGSSVTVCSTCGLITESVTTGGHSYGSWTTTQQPTCTATGTKTRTCSACGDVDTASIAANGHSYSSVTHSATCQEYERIEYTCKTCGHNYSVYADELMSDWLETKPAGVADSLLETKTQYRYSDYQTATSSSSTMAGYTQIGKTWVKNGTSTVTYVTEWPSGFDTTNALYSQYNKTPVSASETETAKTVIDSNKVLVGYLYYHWCYGTYTAGPINRSTSKVKTDAFPNFNAFYADVSTFDPTTATAASDGSITYAHADGCKDSWWWYYIPVYKQTSTTYKAEFTFERWTDYSTWSDNVVAATDTRKVETRTLYRYVNAELGDHSWTDGVCSVCGTACEHSYSNGFCTVCGVQEPCKDYYLFGFINGADYGCEGDYATIGEYKFVDGTLTVNFSSDSYVGVKTSDNSRWYMTDGWLGYDVTSATLYQTGTMAQADKLFVPSGSEVVFTLVDNGDNTFTLSYEVKAPVQPTLTLKYPSLSFESEVQYNVYFSAADLDNVVEMGLITFDSYLPTGTVADAVDVVPGYIISGSLYRVTTNGIPAKKLGDALYFRVYAKLTDGSYTYSSCAGYHAVAYAKDILANSTNTNMKSLVVAMLNYGAAAQVQFNYKTDALVNSFLTNEQKALVDPYSSGMISSLEYVSSSKSANFSMVSGSYTGIAPAVVFDGAFALNFYFKPGYAMDGNLTFYYWTLEDYNAASVLTVNNASGSVTATLASNGMYLASVEHIAAKDLDKTVFVAAVYESGGVRYSTMVIAYSLGAYCLDRVNNGSGTMKELAAYTAVYGYYAKNYFASL